MPHGSGTDALARALIDGGVERAIAFPGSPATVLAQALERDDAISFRWAANENNVLSHAFGSALAGHGAVAIMKHVGVNVALDALQVMGVVHTLAAPLLLVEGADARPGSSQSAQDNRPLLDSSPGLLVLAPTTVEETYALARAGLEISKAFGMVVVLRGDARMFKAQGPFEPRPADDTSSNYSRWPERGWALSTTARTYAHHLRMRGLSLASLSPFVEQLCEVWGTGSRVGTVVAGHLGTDVASAVRRAGVSGMRLLSENPLPEAKIGAFLRDHDEVAVLEECLPHLERRVREIAHRQDTSTRIIGRRELGDERPIGWLSGDHLADVVARLAQRAGSTKAIENVDAASTSIPEEILATQSRALDDGYGTFERDTPLSSFPDTDPRRALFDVLRQLGNPRRSFVATDPGITGVLALGNARTDVKMHMGGAVPIAAGWARATGEDGLAIAVVGDTNLPHSEWLGIVESAAAKDDMVVVIVDNGYSEMTQKIVPLRPTPQQAMASFAGLSAWVKEAHLTESPKDPWSQVLREAAAADGLRIVWLHV
jgi:indolepyruvate ferredoxin oxidoreductase alpha subunit